MPKRTRTNYDGAWKEALEVFFEPFIAFFRPQIHAAIDWDQPVKFLKDELRRIVRGARVGTRRVDELVEVHLKDGTAQWLLVHVEVQNQFDRRFAERMYVYNYRIFDFFRRHPYSLAVLGDRSPAWRPDHFGGDLWDTFAGSRFSVVKLNDYRAQWEMLEQSTNPFAAVVMAHLKAQETRRTPEARYDWKLSFFRRLYRLGYSQEQVEHLVTVLDWLLVLPEALAETLAEAVKEYEEEEEMPYVTSFEQIGIKKGRAEGREEGREEGRAEGREEGLQEGILTTIELGLQFKFGEEGLALMPLLTPITDIERLQRFYLHMLAGADVEELRDFCIES